MFNPIEETLDLHYTFRMFCLFVVASVLLCTVAAGRPKCTTKGTPDIRPDPDNCSVFYLCAKNELFKFECSNSVYDPHTTSCVPKGSIFDKCTRRDRPAKNSVCPTGSKALIHHPTQCALYYNCSAPAQGMRWEEHLQECPYTQVFNKNTKRCEHYSMVKCAERNEPLSHCDYRVNQCESAHCIPCHIRYPNCRGLLNGLNPWVGREGSPYYAVCEGERLLYTGICSQEYGPQIFDLDRKMCVEAVV